uniref:FYVE-type domain-containing protein n=1 Tax=Globisporangium ultimum (strain ATCC 200006 / CBS 805.95 / DAOM BR144) TaxID=431595 RepID=K3W967_GLOUD
MGSSRSNSLTSSFLSTAGGKRVSFSSLSSPTGVSKTMPLPSCYVPVPMNPEAAAALEHDILLASSYSNSSLLYDDSALFEMARAAKKKVESAAKRQVMVGKWKPLVFAGQDCHVFESRTKAKDQYSVVAKLNLPCSLHEIMSVFSSETSSDFHRSMVMLFGELYVYGLNVRSVDCAPYRRSSWAGRSSSKMRRSSHPLDPSKFHVPHPSAMSSSSKLAVNAVSLLMRHHLMWRQQNMSFVDYVEEKFDAKSVTRVLQTMDAHDDESERTSPLEAHESQRHMRGLRGLLAGYVLQEDSEEKFTRLFFYASHKNPDTVKHSKLIPSVVQLLREMAMKLCKLESIVLRRRLGFYPMVAPSEVALLQTACCASCHLPFSVLRKKHFCYLCGQYTCRKCSKVEDIEKVLGMIDRRRVCVSCVRRVSYCVFTMADDKYQQSQKAKSLSDNSDLTNVPEEEFPPILAEDDLALTEIEDLAVPEDYYASNDVTMEKMSKYMKKVLERNVGFPRRNPVGAGEESSEEREIA